ncbi:MAG: DNA mismatch repair endonuclease MutL, partial [Bacilli bacterium]|nr:DNA mismatch repair endonuclease MutL [Bacilli bacterium]
MGNIKILTEDLANKIAAGEVVKKYVSVVKELVENSIDAGSTKIKIDLIESGLKEIKVTDNGKGMNYADALLAFSSHATSKIINEEDLYAISSLGFRGEALPSIAAVSEVTLKTSDGQEGTVLNIKGGKLINEEKGDLRQGTIVTVKNIFYNTPARLKHLSSLYREYAYIIDYINKIALSYPNIAFTLSNDNKISLNTDGSGNQLKVIKEIYGVNITKKMILIEGENNDYDINGYISYPEVTKSNRNHIITLVNNRVVRNLELNRIIIDAYHTYIPHDKYPIVILNINVDPTLVDVNIHPTKLDIKFSQFAELKELVNNVIKEQLMKIRLIPEVEAKQKEQVQPQYEEISFNLERLVEEAPTFYNEVENKEIKTNINEDEKIPEIYPVGLVQGTYIICQNELGMYIIDQHAAQERINYEYYFKKIGNPEVNITSLLLPLNIELPSNEFLIIKQNLDVLNNLGIEIEEIGINTLMVRSHPIWLLEGYEEESIRKIIDLLVVMEKDFNLEKFNEAIAITLSCKMAIKANENISRSE